MRFLPLVVATIVFLCAGVLPIVRYRRRHGLSPIAVVGPLRWALRILAVPLGIQVIIPAVWPSAMAAQMLVRPWPLTGLTLIAIGLIVVMRAQWEMGSSWRIGIDEGARPGLVTTGLYAVSRNPIYFGLFLIVVGYTIAMPTPMSVATVAAGCIAGRYMVLHEEQHLRAAYGAEFDAYAARVSRFTPGIGNVRKWRTG